MTSKKKSGELLRGIRKHNGLSMKQAAEMTGTQYRTWLRWENGISEPPMIAWRFMQIYSVVIGKPYRCQWYGNCVISQCSLLCIQEMQRGRERGVTSLGYSPLVSILAFQGLLLCFQCYLLTGFLFSFSISFSTHLCLFPPVNSRFTYLSIGSHQLSFSLLLFPVGLLFILFLDFDVGLFPV